MINELRALFSKNCKALFIPAKSEVIKSYLYLEQIGVLFVELTSGAIYTYENMNNIEYTQFELAESKGEYYNRVIKTKGYLKVK